MDSLFLKYYSGIFIQNRHKVNLMHTIFEISILYSMMNVDN